MFGLVDRASYLMVAVLAVCAARLTADEMLFRSADDDAMIYTDSSAIYDDLRNHESDCYFRGEYVRCDVYSNSVESFWAPLKSGHYGRFH